MLTGCLFGGGGSDDSTTSGTIRTSRVSTTVASLADAGQQPIVVSPADRYSSFQSKDPFVQQQEPDVTDDTTTPVTTTPSATTTTTTTTIDEQHDHQFDLDHQHEFDDVHHFVLYAHASDTERG